MSKSTESNILTFFNESSKQDLLDMPGCLGAKADLLIKNRPFKDMDDLVSYS